MSGEKQTQEIYFKSNNVLMTAYSVAIMIWGGNWVAAKLIAVQADPGTNMVIRFTVTMMLFFVVLTIAKIPKRLNRQSLVPLVIAGLFASMYQFNFFKGLSLGFAGAGSIIVTTINPTIIHVLDNIFSKRSFKKAEIAGLILAILGTTIVMEVWTLGVHQIFNKGNIFFLFSSFSWAGIIFSSQRVKLHPMTFTMYLNVPTICIGALLTTPGKIVTALSAGPAYWVPIGYLIVLGTLYAASLNFLAVRQLGAKTAASFIYLIPFFALIFSWFVLGETISPSLFIGGAISLGGVLLINRKST